MRVLVLPGMDGGAALSAAFRGRLAEHHDVVAVEYPGDEAWSYERVAAHVRALLGARPEAAGLIAESYSGPVAIRLAAEPPSSLRAVILVATFARSPMPWWVPVRALGPLVRRPPPPFAIRHLMLDADGGDPDAVGAAIAAVSPSVMARRMREVAAVDVRAELARTRVPILALRATRDRLVPASRFVARDAPAMDVRAIEGPHLLLHARPRACADAISSWLSEPAR
ncbi:MAG: hypothetical protein R3B82_03620 [Sandaracinaceae bacterium]